MRKPRENKHNRVYHLISRIAHRAFFLSADERDRFIDIMKRSAAFSGVRLLAWCVMTNHVHILAYVPEPEELSDDALFHPCLKTLLLGHISQECNSRSLTRQTFTNALARIGRSDTSLFLLDQDAPCDLCEF